MRILLRSRPTGVLRLVFRLPIYLYRLRLRWLLGHRGLLLVHRGRKSGRVYRTVLEVVRYEPATRESVVPSAWGEKADWYRNIKASPALKVQTGLQRYVPSQRFLAPEENHAVISHYARRHPLAFRSSPGRSATRRARRRRNVECSPSPYGWWPSAPRIERISPDDVENKEIHRSTGGHR